MPQPASSRRDDSVAERVEIDLPAWASEICASERTFASDESRMNLAIELARDNVARKAGGPFGAAIFDSATGELVGAGMNSVVRLNNSVLHAEMLAIMLAQRKVGSYSLRAEPGRHYELFSTCEPCTMCMGGICWSGITRIVYGATRHDAMEVGFDEGPDIADLRQYLSARGVILEQGLLRVECQAVLKQYTHTSGVIYNGHAMPKSTS
jgi:tRNA(Arg) A34 adenosine deaminase TadA